MSKWYFIDVLNQQRGPFSDENLVWMYNELLLPDNTLVWHQNMEKWQPICIFFNQFKLPPSLPNYLIKHDEIRKKLIKQRVYINI